MDIFNEYIVNRKKDGKDFLKMTGIVFGLMVVMYALMIVLSMFGQFGSMLVFPAFVGMLFLDWYLLRNFWVEYEYSVTNGYMIIDLITAKSKRKRMITFECRDIDEICKYHPEKYTQRTFDKIIHADDNNMASDQWCVELVHKDFGRTLVIFTPSERILAAMKPFLKRQVAFNAFGRS